MSRNRKTYNTPALLSAVQTSVSIAQVLRILGLTTSAANYRTLQRTLKENHVDTSHFTGQGHNKGKSWIQVPIERYLSNELPIDSHPLKLRLIKEGFLALKCSRCGGERWLDSLMPLQLDHINGNHDDNTLTNLRLLCPNCHALTPTYGGKNRAKRREDNYCACGKKIHHRSIQCTPCSAKRTRKFYPRPTKINWPPPDTLISMVNASSYAAVGRVLGVSDNAIRKHI